MKKSSAKKKLFLLKILAVILCPITVFATTIFFVFIGCAELWKDIPTCGITSLIQWFTLISYIEYGSTYEKIYIDDVQEDFN